MAICPVLGGSGSPIACSLRGGYCCRVSDALLVAFAIYSKCAKSDRILCFVFVFVQGMIFVEHMRRALSSYLPTTWASDITVAPLSREKLVVIGKLPLLE